MVVITIAYWKEALGWWKKEDIKLANNNISMTPFMILGSMQIARHACENKSNSK
jgi:hypothetical protein